jgi:chaperone BCS1
VVRGGIAAVADKYIRSADLLKNKSRPEAAADGAAAWVISERELREKLKKEREAKERELEKEVRLADCVVTMSSADLPRLHTYRRRNERKRKAKKLRLRLRPRRKRLKRMTR